jgi:CPA1 family monovalent cation:H+ antiporter
MRDDGLIGAEVYTSLMQNLNARRAATEKRPTLDIAIQRADLVRRFPLFVHMEEAALKQLGASLKTVYVNSGQWIVRKDDPAESVFFIASGAVELESAGQTWRLGGGEMFGQMAILTKKARRAQVRAIAPSTLLVLDAERFQRLLARSDTLQQAIRQSAEKRGIDPDVLLTSGQHQQR